MEQGRSDKFDTTHPRYSVGRNLNDQSYPCSNEERTSEGQRYDQPRMQKSHFGPKNFAGQGPKNYKRSDVLIKEDICEALYSHPQIDASEILVDVQDGSVTLQGSVVQRQLKYLVEDIVEQCFGVTFINNQIKVGHNLSNEAGPVKI